jgi:HEAT repeat protein
LVLIAALEDRDRWVRAYAARALGKMQAHEAIEALERSTYDRDSEVREAAVEALRALE